MILEKYSFGVGDRFGHQGKAQLQAMLQAKLLHVDIVPVWNKSNREHAIVKTQPRQVRQEADEAVKSLDWAGSYYVDADHINLSNVDEFVESCDFFTLDVADFIGRSAQATDISRFVESCMKFTGSLEVPGIDHKLSINQEQIEAIGNKYLLAVQEAGRIYRRVESAKGAGNFVTEVSMDETDEPQNPVELFFILAMIAAEGIPAQTIAPKFIGRFNKGVDYVGDVQQFAGEFEEDLAVINLAIQNFDLPKNLKLSVHSGSDKFSIYPKIHQALKKFDAGLHLKTAGTTWLEELIGLALAGGDGLDIVKQIYAKAYSRFDELCGPYATVIDIDKSMLPTPELVSQWSSEQCAGALRHNQTCALYNLHLRQLFHVAYKVAAELGDTYLGALRKYEAVIAENVTNNILKRHIKPIFIG
ncbi:MAG: hypothetical protein JXD22_07950 [Sedimentisphaerales bacterium]|nr:hypothetical protein [Sedimentisphaerales bacterium]